MLQIVFKFLTITLNKHYFNNMEKQPKTIELPTFHTVEDIMADAYLLKSIDDLIAEMTTERDKVSEGGKIKLKRNAAGFLIDMNKFNKDFLDFWRNYTMIKRSEEYDPVEAKEKAASKTQLAPQSRNANR